MALALSRKASTQSRYRALMRKNAAARDEGDKQSSRNYGARMFFARQKPSAPVETGR